MLWPGLCLPGSCWHSGPEGKYFAADRTADSMKNLKYCTEADEDSNAGSGPTYQDENQCDRSLFGNLAGQ